MVGDSRCGAITDRDEAFATGLDGVGRDEAVTGLEGAGRDEAAATGPVHFAFFLPVHAGHKPHFDDFRPRGA